MDAKSFIETKPDTAGPQPSKYNRGDRVRLAEFDNGDEVIPEADGVVLSVDWMQWSKDPDDYMYVVEVDEQFRGEYDDGLRELDQRQIKEALDA
jgi:hypothetical protein